MKFEVGDKIKVIRLDADISHDIGYQKCVGKTGTVVKIHSNRHVGVCMKRDGLNYTFKLGEVMKDDIPQMIFKRSKK